VHAAIASKMQLGYGGLYRHFYGDEQPLAGTRAVWLTRPRGIRYERPLRDMADGAAGFLSCWRRQMVLGPGDEFVLIGTSRFRDIDCSGVASSSRRANPRPLTRMKAHAWLDSD
jgi:hypothetical protein